MTLQTSGASPNIARHFRSGLAIRQASTTTLEVALGIADVGGVRIELSAVTTLTISTAGDWIGGSSLRAVSTTAYVYIDASGNIKMHTTAPSHSDYLLSVTVGMRRYVSISSTTWRCLGWFRMNATGSGELDTFGVGNVPEFGLKNRVRRKYTAQSSFTINCTSSDDDTLPQSTELTQLMIVGFVKFDTRKLIKVKTLPHITKNNSGGSHMVGWFKDATASAIYAQYWDYMDGSGTRYYPGKVLEFSRAADAQLTYFEIKFHAGIITAGNTSYFNGDSSGRKLGGAMESFIEIEETENEETT